MRRRGSVPARDRPGRDAPAREHARQGLLGRAPRDRRAAARVPEPRRHPGRPEPRLGRRLRRPRAARPPRAAAGRRGPGDDRRRGAAGAEALAARGSSRSSCRRRRASRSSTGRSSWPPPGRSRSSAGGGSRRRRTSPARSRSRRCRARARASCPRSTSCARSGASGTSAANILRLLEGSAILEAHRWCDKVQDAYSLRCAPQVHGASRDLLAYAEATVDRRAERGHRQPARLRRARRARLERQLPRPAARLRARRHGDGARRARVHLRAPRRAAHEPVALGRPAGVPHARRRAQLRVHDPAVRRRGARQREQGALPSGERRLDPDERRPGGSRLDGERRRPQVPAGAGERRGGAGDRAARRRPGNRVPRAARAGGGRARAHDFVRSLSPTVLEDRPLSGDIEALAGAIRSGELVAAVEREIGRSRERRGRERRAVEELCGDLTSIRAPAGGR